MTDKQNGSGPPREGISHAYRNADKLPGDRPAYESKAPNAGHAFERSAQESGERSTDRVMEQHAKARREAFERDRRIHQRPVSKREQEALEKQRATPRVALEPSPDGATKRAIDGAVRAESERRIFEIKRRLERQRGRARGDFDRSR